MEKSKVRCPKCKSRDLILSELWKDHCITWEQNDDGTFDKSDGNIESGNPYKVEAECQKCGHRWTVRKALQINDIIIEP